LEKTRIPHDFRPIGQVMWTDRDLVLVRLPLVNQVELSLQILRALRRCLIGIEGLHASLLCCVQ